MHSGIEPLSYSQIKKMMHENQWLNAMGYVISQYLWLIWSIKMYSKNATFGYLVYQPESKYDHQNFQI